MTDDISKAAAAMGRKGGKSKSPAKSAAARKNAAKAREAIDPEKRAKAVAESNRRRATKTAPAEAKKEKKMNIRLNRHHFSTSEISIPDGEPFDGNKRQFIG